MQRENLLSNVKTGYPSRKHVIQRDKFVINKRDKIQLYNVNTYHPTRKSVIKCESVKFIQHENYSI